MILDVKEIMDILPHRYPMLLVDRIIELEPMKSATGIKCVTFNEPFFQGHFPNHPVMPGIFTCEAMAQVAGVCLLYSDENRGFMPMFTGFDKVRFRAPIVPGDVLRTEASVTKIRGRMGRVELKGFVGDEVRAEGTFMFYLSRKTE